MQLYKYDNGIQFSMDQIIFEPKLELAPKTLDAWSQNRSLKFQFWLYRPTLGYCSLRYKNPFTKRNFSFVI